MFRCLAYLGVVVAGLSIVACWGCGGKPSKEGPPAKNAEQGAKGTMATGEKPEKPATGAAKTPDGAEKPAAGATDTPQGTETPAAADAGETSGRGGRAVGKVLKRVLEKPNDGARPDTSPF